MQGILWWQRGGSSNPFWGKKGKLQRNFLRRYCPIRLPKDK